MNVNFCLGQKTFWGWNLCILTMLPMHEKITLDCWSRTRTVCKVLAARIAALVNAHLSLAGHQVPRAWWMAKQRRKWMLCFPSCHAFVTTCPSQLSFPAFAIHMHDGRILGISFHPSEPRERLRAIILVLKHGPTLEIKILGTSTWQTVQLCLSSSVSADPGDLWTPEAHTSYEQDSSPTAVSRSNKTNLPIELLGRRRSIQ